MGSFSMARHNRTPGKLGPVKDKKNIYGLQGNSVEQQQEADRGTRNRRRNCTRTRSTAAELAKFHL